MIHYDHGSSEQLTVSSLSQVPFQTRFGLENSRFDTLSRLDPNPGSSCHVTTDLGAPCDPGLAFNPLTRFCVLVVNYKFKHEMRLDGD